MSFERMWTAEVLTAAPLIAPAHQVVWPMRIAGEEDALARGAVRVMVRPAVGGAYLVTAALGFRDPSMPNGVFGCPNAEEICVVAGGYAYIARMDSPEQVTMLAMKPVVAVMEAEADGLLLFVGFHSVLAWGASGLAWETGRLSWEGVRVTGIEGGALKGFGWDLMRDLEVEFAVDLRTGKLRGGGWKGSF
jgi:hypothetical protein